MKQLPQWPLRLLRWFCKPWYAESIEGDLHELFQLEAKKHPQHASWWLFINVVRFIRWRYIKDVEDFLPQSSFGMIKTFFVVTFRSLLKSKLQTGLNVVGLALGIASCLLMLMHVSQQLKYDKHVPDLDRIYRVTLNGSGPFTPARLGKQMKQDYPEIEETTRVSGPLETVVQIGDQYINQGGGLLVDSTFFELFPAEFISGDPTTALNGPTDVVLTESLASKLYPGQNPVGATIESMGDTYTITSVVRDPIATSTLPYKYLVAIPWEKWATEGWWSGNNFYTYMKLNEGASQIQLEAKFPDFVEKYVGPELLSYYPQYETFQDYLLDHHHLFKLVPMAKIHLHHPRLTLGKPGDFQSLVIFSLVAIFILMLACVNYINMSTARSSLRAKEIGMRKVLGSIRNQIGIQFLIESLIITMIALFIGVFLAAVFLPYFNQISQMEYQLSDLINWTSLIWFLIILFVTTILSGSYPAIYMASIQPVSALKGNLSNTGSSKIRSGLVTFQFAISFLLMTGTFIVYQQLQQMSNRKLGLDAEQVYIMKGANKLEGSYETFRSELMSYSGISNVGLTNSYPSGFLADWNYQTKDESPVKIGPLNLFVSSEIKDVWGLELLEGRFFEKERATDTACIVVNKQLVNVLGWQDNPLGKVLSRGDGEDFRIIGVVDDFVTGSAKRSKSPLLFRFSIKDRDDFFSKGLISIKIDGEILSSLEHIERIWEKYLPGYPIDATFMDDSFARLYEAERRFGIIFTGFAILAIAIAGIGLFSLATFILERKRKEIAIRKVLGAEVGQIFWKVSAYFFKLIGLGALIAIPVAYYLGQDWLNDYVERIDLDLIIFLVPLIILSAIALLTIAHQVLRSINQNPVGALKEE